LALLEVRDVGKVFSEAVSGDVPSGTDAFDYFAASITAQNGDFNKWDKAIGDGGMICNIMQSAMVSHRSAKIFNGKISKTCLWSTHSKITGFR
tara:strand:+ start:964 stop:1242 length:279 start_codon:yes stop_codon:yes gene_type:complete